jgi:peptidoglycan hydrolase-like protein with peptidoglycan-binding domain
MSRVLFKRAEASGRLVRGEPVKVIQRAVRSQGFDPQTIDGIFGADTEGAVKDW